MPAVPETLDAWSSEIIKKLLSINYEEDQKIEYKEFLDSPAKEPNEKRQYRLSLQEEFCAFANAVGGFILFGVTDDFNLKGVKFDGEINLKISQILSNTTPIVQFQCKQIDVDGKNILLVHVFNSKDKPVQCENGSFYIRLNGKKHPLPRSFLMDWFVSKETKQQILGKLKFEMRHMQKAISELSSSGLGGMPPFNKLRWRELQDALSKYYYIYSNPEAQKIVEQINKCCEEISQQEKYFNITFDLAMKHPYRDEHSTTTKFLKSLAPSCLNTNQNLYNTLAGLKVDIEALEKELEKT
jgi:hypothetical protein